MSTPTKIKSFYDIPGFFWWLDRQVFAAFLRAQQDSSPGDLVELGTYLGKSAVIVGDFLREGERFVAVDLFGREDLLTGSKQDVMNRNENRRQYKSLNRTAFEDYYLQLHPELPHLVEGLSNEIMSHVEPASVRFVHVDAGHMYPQVREDVLNTKLMLRPGGIAVFDDYRSPHTPGVSAAVWEAVVNDGLVPIALTPQKFYGTYDQDPSFYLDAIREWAGNDERFWMQEQEIMGRPVLRVKIPKSREEQAKKAAAKKKAAAAARRRADAKPAPQLSTSQRIVRKVARDYAPPALTRWAVEQRKRRPKSS